MIEQYMSEPMSTVEIEDVLSSIRRLVSEDLRPTQRLVSAALQKGAAKLILTPALRIVPDASVAAVRADQPKVGQDQADRNPDLQASATDCAEIAVEAQDYSAEILPVFGSVRLSEGRSAAANGSLGGTRDANFLASAMSRINGLTGTDAGFDTQPQLGQPAETIEAVVATVGAAVGPDEWEVDGGDPSPQDNAWNAEPWTDKAEPWADKAEPRADKAEPRAVEPEPWADKVEDVATVKEHPTLVLGAADSVAVADTAVDTVVHDTQADTVLVKETSDIDAYMMGADSIVFNQDMAAAKVEAKSDPADGTEFIDEDILRGIVRDMIRQELQGDLGERITSNVRKLVRAEINRALAAHVYDNKARA